MKRFAKTCIALMLLSLAACQTAPDRNQACDGECSGRGQFLYTIEGHPCPEIPPWDDARGAAEESAKAAARTNAAMNCRERSGKDCTCAFGQLNLAEDATFESFEGPISPTDIARPVCVVIVTFTYDGGRCVSTQPFIQATAPDARCAGTVTQGGQGVVTAAPTCPQPCDPSLLDQAEQQADKDAERKTFAACQALGDVNCLAVGGRKIDIGGRCYDNTAPGEPQVCVYDYHTGLMQSRCAFVP